MNPQQQTPFEKLLADKQRLRQSCSEHEKRIGASVAYIQENVGTLLLSGMSSLLFPAKPGNKTAKATKTATPAKPTESTPLGMSDILSMGKALLPVAWDVIQPIIISWSIRTLKKKVAGLFRSGKKKQPEKLKD